MRGRSDRRCRRVKLASCASTRLPSRSELRGSGMADPVSVLATQAQRNAEQMALWLTEQPSARAARERSRAILLEDPVARTADGRALLERALDEWIMFLAMRIANCDVGCPTMVWNADNASRVW